MRPGRAFRSDSGRRGPGTANPRATSSLGPPGATTAGYGSSMDTAEMQRIKDIIEELRRMRQESSGDHYRHYSGAISSLRHILRLHGKDSEPR